MPVFKTLLPIQTRPLIFDRMPYVTFIESLILILLQVGKIQNKAELQILADSVSHSQSAINSNACIELYFHMKSEESPIQFSKDYK
jgi:hypothetical protein